MTTTILLGGLLSGVIATGLVFADTKRRNLPFQTQWLWTASAAVLSIGGFLAVYLLKDVLFQFYLEATGRPALVPSPQEVAQFYLFFALTVSVVAVLGYGFGSRFGPLKSA